MRLATNKDKDIVIDILHSAFVDIKIANSINFVVKQDKKRSNRLRYLMEYMFNLCFKFGEIFLSDNNKGCILLMFPHRKRVSLETILWDIKLAFKTVGLENVVKVLKRESQLKKHHLKEPHIHPLIMGVRKEYQGTGVGPRLIVELLKHYDNNELPVVIETTTDSNLKLYKKFGFKIFKETNDLDYPLIFLQK